MKDFQTITIHVDKMQLVSKKLTIEQKGALFDAIIDYQANKTALQTDDIALDFAFGVLQQSIDFANAKYAENISKKREAGKNSAQARKNNTVQQRSTALNTISTVEQCSTVLNDAQQCSTALNTTSSVQLNNDININSDSDFNSDPNPHPHPDPDGVVSELNDYDLKLLGSKEKAAAYQLEHIPAEFIKVAETLIKCMINFNPELASNLEKDQVKADFATESKSFFIKHKITAKRQSEIIQAVFNEPELNIYKINCISAKWLLDLDRWALITNKLQNIKNASPPKKSENKKVIEAFKAKKAVIEG